MNRFFLLVLFSGCYILGMSQKDLRINDRGYFEMQGLNVMVFSDTYPDGHQTGITIIQHGSRVAANGDLRLEPSPGQWSPVPKTGELTIDKDNGAIIQQLWYPDSSKSHAEFNPIDYPDLNFFYSVEVQALEGSQFCITVQLVNPLPEEWIGKIGFNLELFPGNYFGKSWILDRHTGIFPQQPNGPLEQVNGEILTRPMASGKKLTVAPESAQQRITIESKTGNLELRDGRSNHNNGWFIVREKIMSATTKNVVKWIVHPHVINDWIYAPVIQVSQVGYYPDQTKKAIIEADRDALSVPDIKLYKLTSNGKSLVKEGNAKEWGAFLRYRYFTFDFSEVCEPAMYLLEYDSIESNPFKIDADVYSSNVWQPVIEYFLPVQMCHMRVNEKYRVWHESCHLDDALMAPPNTHHFDGYRQEASALTAYNPLEHVPGMDRGGWHDAGDYDLRVESQIGTVWNLALMIEEFGLNYDATTIDNDKRLVEIHQPDGKSDLIQQIEHGLASVIGGYRSMGRLYRGIICSDKRQYVMLGDASAMTDKLIYSAQLKAGEKTDTESSLQDDRWVFTEDNPKHELNVVAGLAAASRVLGELNPELATEALQTAVNLFQLVDSSDEYDVFKVLALTELFLTTKDSKYSKAIVRLQDKIIDNIQYCGWTVGRVISAIDNDKFKSKLANAVGEYQKYLRKEQEADSPYGVPYKPRIWGAGWNIQRFGVQQYFFCKGWPELCNSDLYVNALNFVLGVHPGENTASFASGVGSKSVITAYGFNRADWSYIPGGVVSGTALIRPDLPELKVWPYLWQQSEYVMGGGATNFMFLVLAVEKLYR